MTSLKGHMPPVETTVKRACLVGSDLRLKTVLACVSVMSLTFVTAAFGEDIPFEMWDDPKIELPEPIITFSPKLVPLWEQALDGPEVDLRRQAADNVILAHERGMRELEGMVEPLRRALRRPDLHPLVALAATRALVALNARGAADELFAHCKTDGMDVAGVVEPALAQWDYGPIRPVWLERLKNPQTHRRRLITAINGLAVVGEVDAVPNLLELSQSTKVPGDVRLAAARSLGLIEMDGLDAIARKLADDKSPSKIVDRVIAASMIASHRDESSLELMMELAVDSEPAVAAIALATLLEIDPDHVLRVVEVTIANADANVRRLGARALVARPTLERVKLLGPMLDDPHPGLREYVRQSLEAFAEKPELADQVIDLAVQMLRTSRWRGLEQASLLLTALDHKPAAQRLAELLDFNRPEVFVSAAWGLGRLAVPETFAAMCEKARIETEKTLNGERCPDAVGRQVCYLNQALGRLKYAPCDDVLRSYIPKSSPFPPEFRAGAIWALGHLHAGNPDDKLAGQLGGRLADVDSAKPEDDDVRRMSAISMGRMKAEKSLDLLREFLNSETVNRPAGYACGWAIELITGEPMDKPTAREVSSPGWFLDPLDR
jgi:HEAT repeat protein